MDHVGRIDEIMLEWLKVTASEAVSPEFAATLRADVDRLIWGSTLRRLTAQVLAEQLPPERVERSESTTFTTPASWWQAWKAEHLRVWRGWLVRRWPVRLREERRTLTVTVDLRRFYTYPKQRLTVPQAGAPVRVAIAETAARWVK